LLLDVQHIKLDNQNVQMNWLVSYKWCQKYLYKIWRLV